MAFPGTYRLHKLQELARTHQIPENNPLPRLHKLSKSDIPDFTSPQDNADAEQLLAEHQGSIKKPIIRTKRRLESHAYKNVTEILPQLVRESQNPGVVQALMRKASNAVQKAEKRVAQTKERNALLATAVDKDNLDLVSLFAPECSEDELHHAIKSAIHRRNEAIVLKLLENGADPNASKHLFIQACRTGDHWLVSLLVRAPTRVQKKTLNKGLTAAVKCGSIQTVGILAQAAGLENAQDIPAVHEAVRLARVDILLTILLRTRSMDQHILDGLVATSFEMSNTSQRLRLQIIEVLFYAGASGDRSAASFAHAVALDLTDFIYLFAKHHVDLNWANGKAVMTAARTGRSDLIKAVLAGGCLSPDNASRALEELPRHIRADERQKINRMLLAAGAHGSVVDEELVLAVKDNDEASVIMLLENGASLNRNEGDALVEAIRHEHVSLLRILLTQSVSSVSFQKAFPHLKRSGKVLRLQMTKMLLEAGASGEAIDAALRDAVCDQSENRDAMLIDLLAQSGADPTYNDAQSLRDAVSRNDVWLFTNLLNCPAQVSQGIVSSLAIHIMKATNRNARFSMMRATIEEGASVNSVSEVLAAELSASKAEPRLVELLIHRGSADVDYDGGKALRLAALGQEDNILKLVSSSPKLSRQTTTKALCDMLDSQNFDDEQKALRAKLLLSRKRIEGVANKAFLRYVNYCKNTFSSGRQWPLQTFKILLEAQADINMDDGAVFISVVAGAAIPLMMAMLASGTVKQEVIDKALAQSMRIARKEDRLETLSALLKCRPSADGAACALIIGCQMEFLDVVEELVRFQASVDFEDHASIRIPTLRGNFELLSVFLRSNLSYNALSAAFEEAIQLPDKALRYNFMEAILQAGLRGDIVDQHLIALVLDHDATIKDIGLLLDHEACVHAQDSSSVVFAATLRRRDVLALLFTRVVLPNTASLCFEACISAGLVQSHEIRTLRFLLEQGVDQKLRDEALLLSVQNLSATPPGGLPIVNMLVNHGAKADLAAGQALYIPCEKGRADVVLAVLRSNPSRKSRSRALHHLVKCINPSADFCNLIQEIVGSSPLNSTAKDRPNFVDFQPSFESAVRVLLRNRPSDPVALRSIISHGAKVTGNREKDILHWSLSRTAPSVSDSCLQVLIDSGAHVNYVAPTGGDTILITAITTGRSKLIDALVGKGADVSVINEKGVSPLMLASEIGNTAITARLIKAGARINDGSLHQGARSLRVNVVRILLQNGANPNYRSSRIHGGRTPLGELYLTGNAAKSSSQLVEETISELLRHNANVEHRTDRKPLIYLAFENPDPVPMVQTIMAAYLGDRIDEDFNLYEEDDTVYSPTCYLSKTNRVPTALSQELVRILRTYGSNRDVYYKLNGPQPDDAKGMPPHIAEREERRRDLEAKIAEEEAAHKRKTKRVNDEEAQRQMIEQQRFNLEFKRNEELGQQRLEQAREQYRQQIALDSEQKANDYNHQRWLDELSRKREQEQYHLRQVERGDNEAHRQKILNIENAALRERLAVESNAYNERQAYETSAYRERDRIEVENRKQIGDIERGAIDYKAKLQEDISQKDHKRIMAQLALAKALPVGRLQLAGSPSGGGFIEGPAS